MGVYFQNVVLSRKMRNFFFSGREQKYEDGIALLRNALANQSDCVLHRILGDFLVAVNEYQEAMDQYSIALR